eukprot:TRINITY_DN1642_c0_g1_i1.p1 TRINITY_DN1642_c0_g1~~TRINITY_DN1642_c0_g1_i1.p1  ORF type:complete len:606 (+),score=191.49 TRINITY_DN1642_c0_g1_i1:63-1880(+)
MVKTHWYVTILCLAALAGGGTVAAAEVLQKNETECCECAPYAPPVDNSSSGLPLPLSISMGAVLLALSGCFSGLTLGLLGLDSMALKAIAEAGTSPTREYAQRIIPLREDGNLLLCTLLLGNVMVNVMIPILLAGVTNGLLGFIFSTVFIVIFGEIVPQATCSKHALYIGSKSIPLVSFFMFVLYIFAKPIAMMLDRTIGGDAGQIYDKQEIKQLLWQHLHEDKLEKSEFKMISRALDMQKTTVESVMTADDKTFKLELNTVLTMECLTEIWRRGHSRIPVVELSPNPEQVGKERETYVGVLYAKDLITVRVEDKVTVAQILSFYSRGMPIMLDKNTKLDRVLDTFRRGKSHIAMVTETFTKEAGDPTIDVVGVVTLEDVIEQLVGEEIVDEHDCYEDIGAHRLKKTVRVNTMPIGLLKHVRTRLTTDQGKAVTKYLESSLSDPLAMLSYDQLYNMVMNAGVKEIRLPQREAPKLLEAPENVWVYRKGKPLEYFTFIFDGKVEAIAGEEKLRAEYGPNTFLGARVLREGSSIKSDFDCRVLESPLMILQLSFKDLEQAKKYGESGSVNGSTTYPDDEKTLTPISPTLRYSPALGPSVPSNEGMLS